MLLLSQIRLGLAQGLIGTDMENEFCVYQLMIGVMPANLALMNDSDMSPEEIEEYRAKLSLMKGCIYAEQIYKKSTRSTRPCVRGGGYART